MKAIDKMEVLEEWVEDGITIKKLNMTQEEYDKRFKFYTEMQYRHLMINRLLVVKEAPFAKAFGEQYTYAKNGNRISLLEVEGLDWRWEIFVIDGGIKLRGCEQDEDIEVFNYKQEAIARIKELLK